MRAGNLRESVTFQRRSAGDDGMGNATTGVWTDIADCVAVAAQLQPMKQTEVVLSEGVQGRILFQLHVRATDALAGVKTGDRAVNARTGQTYNVKGPPMNPDQRGRALQFLVEQGGADG